jgi:hypothetical protein
MIIEDTGERPKCPICGSEESCKHRVAVLDLSFLECVDGVLFDRTYEFLDILRDSFAAKIESGADIKYTSDEVNSLWEYAKSQFDPVEKEIEIDSDIFYRLLGKTLEEAGADSIGAVTESGPGMSSSLRVFYADEPELVIQESKALLSRMLAS